MSDITVWHWLLWGVCLVAGYYAGYRWTKRFW